MTQNNNSGGFGKVLFATVLGFIAGILLAPKSGEETRKEFGEKAKKYNKQANHGLEVAKGVAEASKKELKIVATEAMQDARELSEDAKIRAKRTAQNAKTSAKTIEAEAREAWSARPAKGEK